MNSTKPNVQRAQIAIVLIWAVLVAEVLAFFSSYLQYDLLQAASSGFISEEAAAANDAREQAMGGIYFLLFVGSGFAFLLWFRRAYYNLQQRTGNASFTDGGQLVVGLFQSFASFVLIRSCVSFTRIQGCCLQRPDTSSP